LKTGAGLWEEALQEGVEEAGEVMQEGGEAEEKETVEEGHVEGERGKELMTKGCWWCVKRG
jgi:hypothetical protein